MLDTKVSIRALLSPVSGTRRIKESGSAHNSSENDECVEQKLN